MRSEKLGTEKANYFVDMFCCEEEIRNSILEWAQGALQ